jgi:predicted ribosomally synthesized peptide with nif11-like leader
MSVQAVKEFIKKIHTDAALRKRLESADNYEARQQVIKAAGYEFTSAEYQQAVKEMAAAAGKELTPEELQDIAAGTGRPGSGCIVDTNPCIVHWGAGGPI